MNTDYAYECECMLEDCHESIPSDEYQELREQKYKAKSSTCFITLKGHYDPEINNIIAETEHLVLREYTDGRYDGVYDE